MRSDSGRASYRRVDDLVGPSDRPLQTMMDCPAFKRDSRRSLSIKARVEWHGGQRFFCVSGAQWTLSAKLERVKSKRPHLTNDHLRIPAMYKSSRMRGRFHCLPPFQPSVSSRVIFIDNGRGWCPTLCGYGCPEVRSHASHKKASEFCGGNRQ